MNDLVKPPKEIELFIAYCEKYHYPEILERIASFRKIQAELAQAMLDKHVSNALIKNA